MKVESLIRRKNGTKITMQGTPYHFRPDELGRHVADIINKSHLKKFLAIPEGYSLVLDDDDTNQPKIDGDENTGDTIGIHSGMGGIAGRGSVGGIGSEGMFSNSRGEGTIRQRSDVATDENGQDDSKRDKHDRSQHLVDQFFTKFGRLPHHAWDDQRIIDELNEV